MERGIWTRLANVDRRIIWGIQLAIMTVILLRPIGFPVPVGDTTQDMYDFYESLPEGSIVWFEFGYAVSGEHEINALVAVMFHHAFQRNLRVVASGLWPFGPDLGQRVFENAIEPLYDVDYGVDYVNLGFNPGGEMLARQLVDDVWNTVRGVDHFGNRLADLPLMAEVPRLTKDYVAAICVFTEGSPGPQEWLEAVTERTGIPLTVAAPTGHVPGARPFLASGQYAALLPGARGCAEYEFLVGQPGSALGAMDVLSGMTLYLWLLVVLGNIAYVATQKRKR